MADFLLSVTTTSAKHQDSGEHIHAIQSSPIYFPSKLGLKHQDPSSVMLRNHSFFFGPNCCDNQSYIFFIASFHQIFKICVQFVVCYLTTKDTVPILSLSIVTHVLDEPTLLNLFLVPSFKFILIYINSLL
jgi:hypothetical protein